MITLASVKDLMDILRDLEAVETSWPTLLQFFAKSHPSGLWAALPEPDLQQDVVAASAWITREIDLHRRFAPPTGLYFGLDTLNMDSDPREHPGVCRPFNVEIGGCSQCDPSELTMDWTFHCDWHGHAHLIEGLRALKHVYDEERWPSDDSEFADYMVVLGYSGLALAAAIANLESLDDYLAVWGFHDGDMFYLARKRRAFEKLALFFPGDLCR
jgi:hypothetical protein